MKPTLFALPLFFLLVFQVGSFIVLHSPTYDEPAYIGAGASYIKTGRLDLDIREHPPLFKYLIGLSLQSAGASFSNPIPLATGVDQYRAGFDYIFRNKVSPEKLVAIGRIPSLLVSIWLACLVFLWAARWWGEGGGLLALAAYALEPNIIAHSGLATLDLGLAAFLFATVFFLVRWFKEEKRADLFLCGLFAGCAAATKVQGLVVYVWALLLFAIYASSPTKKNGGLLAMTRHITFVLLVSALVFVLTYQVRYLPMVSSQLHYRFQQTFLNSGGGVMSNYLHGEIKIGGWPRYYTIAFLIKTPLPFLILFFWSLISLRKKKEALYLFAPAALYFGLCSFSSKQQGLRYLLPIYPFLSVLIGGVAFSARGKKAAAVFLLILWMAAESLYIYPHDLAYFNELVGGPSKGHEWLVDCNLDWGQDFLKLKKYLEGEGRPETIVATFGALDRDHYLGPHQDLIGTFIGRADQFRHLNSENPARELLVVSATWLQGLYLSDPKVFDWLKERVPVARPGYGLFVYDITRDAVSEFNVGLIYIRNHQPLFALRQFQRALKLEPANKRYQHAVRETEGILRA